MLLAKGQRDGRNQDKGEDFEPCLWRKPEGWEE